MTSFPLRARIYLGASLLGCLVYYLAPPRAAAVLYDMLGAAAAIALLVGGLKRPPGRRLAWYLLAAGMLGYVAGDTYWTGYELAGREAPFPSWADAMYLAAYPLWTIGLLILARRRAGRADRDILIDAAIVTAAAALLSWVFLIGPQVDADEPALVVLTSIAYPIADLLLLGVLVRMLLGIGGRTTSYRFLLAGLAVTLVSDVAYTFAVLGGWYRSGSWIDLGWLLLYAAWGTAALSPSPGISEETDAIRPRYPLMWRLAPFATAALVITMLDILEVVNVDKEDNAFAIGVGAAVTFALIAVRVGLMFRRIERDAEDLAAQGRTLRQTLDELHIAQADRTRLLDRTIRATEEERARVAVELHDGPIQRLTALSFRLGRARTRLRAGDTNQTDESLSVAERELGEHIDELRRLMSDLRPPALDEGGVEAALRDQLEIFRERSGAQVSFESDVDRELSGDTQVVLYRITQEALANVLKHAHAQRVRVRLSTPNRHASLQVEDDGVGFDQGRVHEFARDGHFGLAGMAQRASMVGGTFHIVSEPGRGTSVRADVPARNGR
jgi:signal transduction histidine kinase